MMSRDFAKFVLSLDFNREIHARFDFLSVQCQERELTPDEAAELDSYIHFDNLLAMMRLRAERALGEE